MDDVAAANRRTRRLVSGIATSILSRGVAVLAPLVLIPITLSYLGKDVYGLWMAITSAASMAAFADFGLGNGLMTKLATTYASGDRVAARDYISTAYALLTSASCLLCAALWIGLDDLPWPRVFNAEGTLDAGTTSLVTSVCLSAFLVNIPLSLVTRIQYAYQMVGQSGLWQALGSLLPVPFVALAAHQHASPIVVILIAVSGLPFINALNTVWLFTRRFPDLRPHWACFARDRAAELTSLGAQFLGLTVVMSMATNADNIIVAHAVGLAGVTAFAVPARLFSQLGQLVSMVNVPLWPAHGEALARGDVRWVRDMTRRMVVVSGASIGLLSVPLVAAGGPILDAWLGVNLEASVELMAGMALWWFLLAGMSPIFMVQNSVGVVLPQLLGWIAFLVVSVPLRWLLANAHGTDVVPWVSVAVYCVTVAPSAVIGYRKAVHQAMRQAMRRTD